MKEGAHSLSVQRIGLVLVGLALTALLAGSVMSHRRAVRTGAEVVLKAQGYDPRDPLRGHYAQVSYANALGDRWRDIEVDRKVQPGAKRRIWAVMDPASPPQRGVWRIASLTRDRPETKPGQIAVRVWARISDAKNEGPAGEQGVSGARAGSLHLGIERIYAQADEALAIEKAARQAGAIGPGGAPEPDLFVIAALGKDGQLRVTALEINGARKDFD